MDDSGEQGTFLVNGSKVRKTAITASHVHYNLSLQNIMGNHILCNSFATDLDRWA